MIALLVVAPWLYNPIVTQVAVLASNTDPLPWLFNLGTAGVWVVCTMTGLQPTRGEVRRLDAEIARLSDEGKRREEKDRAKDQAVEALVSLMTSRTLPSLANAVAEMPQAQQAVQSDTALGKRLEDALARIERVLGDERST